MKTKLKNIAIFFLLICTGVLVATSCDDSHTGKMDFDGEVKILSLSTGNIDAVIDHNTRNIVSFVPWSYNIAALDTKLTTSEGATVEPGNEQATNLTQGRSYLVTNGNLFSTYQLSVIHSQLLNFNVGKYAGTINHTTGAITVKYPMGEPLTDLFTTFTISHGATASKESNARYDYTNPVTFTLSHAGEKFDYVVTVVPTSFQPIGFLGTSNKANDIENEDEKEAFKWFNDNAPNAKYVSFNDVRDGNVDLSEFAALWWYLDGNTRDLPSIATSPAVLNKMKLYFENGGSFFLSSWAVQYVANIGAAKDNKPTNNMWGETNAKDAVTVSDPWGVCFTGHESHPIFAGLDKPAGVNNKVFLLSSGIKVKAHNAIWNFTESWVDYKSKSAWELASGGVGLASFHWNDGNNERAVIFEYPKIGKKGGVVCIGSEAYDWAVEGTNTNQHNIEKLTSNILEYLSN